MHYYKRNLGDYAKKAGRLSMLEHGAYTLLIDACYDRERFPTEDDAIEWAWARTDEEIAAVKFVLSRFFVLQNGVYVQDRINEEVEAYQRNAENNARIAKEREDKRRKAARTVHGPCESVNEAPPNQEPLTINQEPSNTIVPTVLVERTASDVWQLPDCPYQDLLNAYAETLPELSQVAVLNSQRRTHVKARWREVCAAEKFDAAQGVAYFKDFFAYVRSSPFLMGRAPPDPKTGRVWQADFDFLFSSSGFVKVIEGKYHKDKAA